MNKQLFFDTVRSSVFKGKLSDTQVSGIENIITYRDTQWPKMSNDELAYLLATVAWETAWTMQPIKEMGGPDYLKSKKYYPWYGRGLIQITWKANYDKFGISSPDDALKWPKALDVCFRGMILGMFTGKKLSDYIGASRDYVNARRIINGTDKAAEIAKVAESFRSALVKGAGTAFPSSVPETPKPPVVPEDTFRDKLISLLKNDVELQNLIKDITV